MGNEEELTRKPEENNSKPVTVYTFNVQNKIFYFQRLIGNVSSLNTLRLQLSSIQISISHFQHLLHTGLSHFAPPPKKNPGKVCVNLLLSLIADVPKILFMMLS